MAFLEGARSPEGCVVGSLAPGLPRPTGGGSHSPVGPGSSGGHVVLLSLLETPDGWVGGPDPDSVRAWWDLATWG